MTETDGKTYSKNAACQKIRLIWIDIAKGIAMLLTIAGHTYPAGIVRTCIFSFHMPFFLFLSGYNFKPLSNEGNWKYSFARATVKDAQRLLIPYLFIRILNVIIDLVNGTDIISSLLKQLDIILVSGFDSAYVWFLPLLFWAKFIYRLIFRIAAKYRFLLICFISFLGMHIGANIIHLSQNLDTALVALLFIEIGYSLKTYEKSGRQVKEIIFIAAFFIWGYLAYTNGVSIELAMRIYTNGIECMIAAAAGCFAFTGLSRCLEQFHEKNYLVKLISFIGKYSIDMLCIHQTELYLINWTKNGLYSSSLRILLDISILVLWRGLLFGIRKIISKLIHKK